MHSGTCFSSHSSLQQRNGCSLSHQLPVVLLGAVWDPQLGLGAYFSVKNIGVGRVSAAALLCRPLRFPTALIFSLIQDTQYRLQL